MKFAIIIGFLFKLKLFYVNTRECISSMFLKHQLGLKCMKHNSNNPIPIPNSPDEMDDPPKIPIEVFNIVHVPNKNNNSYNKKGCDNRPYNNIEEYDQSIIRKYIKMQNILEKLKKQLDENKANGIQNDDSIYEKFPQLNTIDISPVKMKKGGLMKDYEGYFFTDW